ncbi:MAG: type III secretion system export apparatus subunit SctR [Polyangiaceae bacterium]|nr:type III secretion system export apparatus subunit SctR [Polyangiaceae bacterium]
MWPTNRDKSLRRAGVAVGAFVAFALASPLARAAAEPVRVEDVLGKPIALVALLALASIVPFVFMGMTAFVKISTTLQIVKSAIGAQSVPSNTVVMALATALTLVAMAPVGQAIFDRTMPLVNATKDDATALVGKGVDAVREPVREFLKANASEKERVRFLGVAKHARSADEAAKIGAEDLTVLVPAFVVTELTEAFAIGFLIYLPFLVIDLVVANVLLALGMQMLNPTQVSLPFKLLLFVAIDGWGLLAQALVSGYR